MDGSAVRNAVFESVLKNSRIIRYGFWVYQRMPLHAKAALVLLYGLKCYLSIHWHRADSQQIIYFGPYPSEKRILTHVQKYLNDIPSTFVETSLVRCFSPFALSHLMADLPALPRLYKHALHVAKRNEFMPALRVFSTIGYYARFSRLLAGSNAKAVFIASHYSPEALGLAVACHNVDRQVFFTNHANTTSSERYVPPVYADLLALTSQAVADTIIAASAKKLNIVPIPIDSPYHPLLIPNSTDVYTIGIYLTALTDQERLIQLVEVVSANPQIKAVFVRLHPAQIVNTDLSDLLHQFPSLLLSQGTPLLDDINRTDIAVCGNSTVAIELLRSGRPVLYDEHLDHLTKDYNGYYAKRLVPICGQTIARDFLKHIQQHYSQDSWEARMKHFDYGYNANNSQMLQDFRDAIDTRLSFPSEVEAHEN